jgi:H+/Cl- antiporter ClcA
MGIEGRPTTHAPRLLGPGIVAGLTGFETMKLILPGNADLRYTLPDEASEGLATLGWGLLGGALAAAAAALLLVSIAPTRGLADRVSPVPRACIGGFVLGLCGLAQPLVLFSGEHEAQDLIDGLATWTVGALLVILALKIVATATSMATGYFGGQIFPGAFVGMAAAALVVAVDPSAPGNVLVAAGAGAGTTVLLRRPFASALIMLFFFPLSSAIPLIVGAGMGAAVVSLLRDRLPAPAIGGH